MYEEVYNSIFVDFQQYNLAFNKRLFSTEDRSVGMVQNVDFTVYQAFFLIHVVFAMLTVTYSNSLWFDLIVLILNNLSVLYLS